MNDDFSDWGDNSVTAAAPAVTPQGNEDPFADWGSPSDKAAPDTGMSWTDVPASITADAAGFLGANLTAGQLAAEKSNHPTAAGVAQAGSTMLHEAEDWLRSKETDAFKKSQEAAAFADEGQEQLGANPFRQLVAKLSGVAVPGLVAGAGAMAGGYGAVPALAYYGYVQDLDKAIAWTNKANDEELATSAPVFGDLRKMHIEDNLNAGMSQADAEKQASYDARADLHSALYTGSQALFSAGSNALLGAGANKLLKGGVNTNKLVDLALGALETGTGMGAAGAASEYSRQSSDIAAKDEGQVDPSKMFKAFLNGEVEGILFSAGHSGASAGIRRLADIKSKAAPATNGAQAAAPATTMSPDLFKDKQAANLPPEGNAAPSTGAAPKTARATTQPAPNEAAQEGVIGNTVNPPTRDQGVGPAGEKIKAKSRSKKAEVTGSVDVLDGKEVAPDQAAALAASTPGPADVTMLAEPQAPVDLSAVQVPPERPPGIEPLQRQELPDTPVTPEVARANEVPEAPATIEAQRDDFENKRRDAIRFENAGQVPDDVPANAKEYEAPDGSVWWYQGKTNLRKIRKAIKDGTENELLGLGPYSKPVVDEAVLNGETPAAAVTRTEDGVEKAAAATTLERAPETLEALRDNAASGDTVGIEQPQGVIEGRENGTGIPPAAPSEPVQPTGRILRAKQSPEELARIKEAEDAENARLIAEKRKAEQITKGQEEKPEAVQGERKSKDQKRVDAAAANAEKAKPIFDAHPPTEAEAALEREGATKQEIAAAKTALLDRARRVVEAAQSAGYKIPDFIRKHLPHETFIKNAQKLLNKYGKSKAFERTSDEPFIEFLKSERLQRGNAEDFKVDLADRRQKGDEGFQKKTGDFEREVADESPVNIEADTVRNYEADQAREGREEETLADEETPEARDRPNIFKTLRKAGTAEKLVKLRERLVKVKALADGGATEGERSAASNRMRRLQERFKEELKDSEVTAEDFITKGADKAGTFKVEPKRRAINKPKSRSFEETDFTREFEAAQKSERGTGEREGHVSYGYGDAVASGKIGRTAKVRDVFDKETFKHSRTEGLFGSVFRHIRGKLIDVVGDADVHFISAEEMAAIHPGGEKAKGFYKEKARGEGGYIVMREGLSKEEMAHVFTHEALHAATADALSTHERLADQVKSIMSEVADSLSGKPELRRMFERAMLDEHEFIAEAFSNRAFQEHLTTVKVSPKLAKALGMPETRAQSVWRTIARAIQKALGFEPGTVTALEALLKPTSEAMDLYGGEGRGEQHSLTADDITRGVRRARINLGERARNLKRSLQTNTMIAMSARRLGDNFFKLTREADDLSKQMEVERMRILESDGGEQLAVEAAERARLDPAGMERGSYLADRATALQVDPTRGAANDHVYKVKDPSRGGQWWQAKKALDPSNPKNIKKQWADFERDHPETAKFIEKAAKWGQTVKEKQTREMLEALLRRADIYSPGLRDRILKEGGVPDADKALFKSETFVNHVDRLMEAEGRKGFYFPAQRSGEFVVAAKREFDVPNSPYVHRITDNGQTNVVQFIDPTGGRSELKARRAAKDYAENHTAKQIAGEDEQLDTIGRPEKVWVDKKDPTQLLDQSDVDAIPAYRVRLQDNYMSKFEDKASAVEKSEELAKAGWTDIREPDVQRLNPNAKWGGFMPSQYEAFINSLRNRDNLKGLSPTQQAEVIAAAHQANIALLPGMRLQHSRLQRKNVAGNSKDLAEVIRNWVQMDAGYRSRLRYTGDIHTALDGMRAEAERMNDKKNDERRDIIHALEDRIFGGQEFQKTGRVMAALGKASMVGKLFGPSQPIINATEVGMVTAPVLAGYHGVGRATAAIAQAYKVIGAARVGLRGVTDFARAFHSDYGFTSYRDFIKNNIDAAGLVSDRATRLKQVIDHLHDLNLLGHEAGMEIQRLGRTGDTAIERFLDRTDLMFRQVNQAIEAINRSVTGIAAYELQYQKNGHNHLAAMEYARDVVHDTMGDYSASNAAPIFNTKFGKLALQFKKYAQKSYGLLGKMTADAYHGDNEAKRAFIGVMLTHGVAAGAIGLPGMEIIKAALLVPGLLGGYSWDDFQDTVRGVANDLFGQKLGEAVTKGFPRLAGVDVSGRVGWDSLALPHNNPTSYKDIKEWGYDIFSGAPGSLPLETVRSLKALVDGEGLGKALDVGPSKFGRDIYRAVHGYTSGLQNETGREKIPPLSIGQAATYAAGFRPAGVAAMQEKQEFMRRQTAERTGDRQKLINKWVNAEPGDKAAAREAVIEYNKTVPGNARILPKDLIGAQKRRNTEKRTGSFQQGIRVNKRNRDLFNQATEIYGGQ